MGITYGPIERWPRKLTVGRKPARFRASYGRIMELLEYELFRAGARGAVVQLALNRSQFRVSDGKPYANATPAHPGVIVSFQKGKLPLSFPCDTYDNYLDNLYAIALALEALRKVDRYGVTQHAEQYRGWAALPPGQGAAIPASSMTVEEAATFIGNEGGPVPWGDVLRRLETFRAAYRRAALKYHPDHNRGVQSQSWQKLNEARDLLEKHHESQAATV